MIIVLIRLLELFDRYYFSIRKASSLENLAVSSKEERESDLRANLPLTDKR